MEKPLIGRFLIGVFLFASCQSVLAGEIEPLLLPKVIIGSNHTIHPITNYFNAAFDTTQNPYYFSQKSYFSNHEVLWKRVRSPFSEIKNNGGFGKFLTEEVVGVRALPNYTLHLLGGGYDFRLMAEWYQKRGASRPYLWAFLTNYLANIGNEALETSAHEVSAFDNIADLFIFDVVGKLLFMNDDVARFAHDTLQMRTWHFQPFFDFTNLHIENAGINYALRPRLFGKDSRVRPFLYLGLQLLLGASYQINGTDELSLGFGLAFTDPLNLVGYGVTGLFWDRNDALLASLILNGTSNLRARLNVYPFPVRAFDLDLGLTVGWDRDDIIYLGASVELPLGVGASSSY